MRKYLFKLLGRKNYLRTLHLGFHFLYAAGALKKNESYKYHYFDKNIIQKGDYILDIGANLGYYTKLFAEWAGKTGKVYAVEPVTIFADVIKWGTKKYNNITVYNYALGKEEKEVTLSTPGKFGYLRTGLPHVVNDTDTNNYEFTFKAQMKKGSLLFSNLPKINFIKCDIEGYEEIVLPEMRELLMKHKPVIQLETWGEHKPKTESFLTGIGYEIYDIADDKLKPLKNINNPEANDLFFVHKENRAIIELLRKKGHA